MTEFLVGVIVGIIAMGAFYIYKRGKFIEILEDAARMVEVLEDELEDAHDRFLDKMVEVEDEKQHSEALQNELFEAAAPKGLLRR